MKLYSVLYPISIAGAVAATVAGAKLGLNVNDCLQGNLEDKVEGGRVMLPTLGAVTGLVLYMAIVAPGMSYIQKRPRRLEERRRRIEEMRSYRPQVIDNF
jgi:hypothetical protein